MTAFPIHCRRILLATFALLAVGVSQAMAQSPFTLSGSPPLQPPANMKTGEGALIVSARYSSDGTAINGGLHWRVYADKPDQSGVFRLLKEDSSAQPTFVLPAGSYVVHVAFGLASTAKAVQVGREPTREVFEIAGGGLRVEGRVGNVKIPTGQISFDIYQGSQFEQSDRRPIASSVQTGAVVLVPEGTYYILSKYGDGNAVVRSDIRVQAGKLTDVTVSHRAAVITLKLVSDRGGEALANTAWSVITPGGDVIKESIGAFPRVVLSEGEYRAIAKNEGKVFERPFNVVNGVDGEVEVVAR